MPEILTSLPELAIATAFCSFTRLVWNAHGLHFVRRAEAKMTKTQAPSGILAQIKEESKI